MSLSQVVDYLRESIALRINVFPILTLLYSSLFSFLNKKYYSLIALPHGLKAFLPLKYFPWIWLNVLHIYYYRDYEQLREFIPRDNWTIVDIGAFVGLYSIKAARLAFEGRVYAVEPTPFNYRFLLANISLNKLSNVKTINVCISTRSGTEKIYVAKYGANSSLLKEYVEDMDYLEKVVEVKSVKLESLIRQIGVVDLMKIDIEGIEEEIIKNSRNVLKPKYVKKIVVEVHPNYSSVSTVSNILEENGYNVAVFSCLEALEQVFVYAY